MSEYWEYGQPSLLESIIASIFLSIFLLGGTTIIWFLIKMLLYLFRKGVNDV